ncbi:MAG TPA: Flp pilus assembly protein CpaB [Candidatus Limnocylindria bacterium]|nr:Flp pilus assembly protein CpaB [Candidatus Limnocylindria bacterium]
MQDGSKRRARLILIIGIVLALIAGAGTYFVASSAQTAAPPVIETTPVLVAAREIPAKTTLTMADLKEQPFNVDAKPPAALVKREDAVGKVTIQAIGIGEPLTPAKFSDPKNPAFVVIPASFIGPDGAPRADSPNFRAMSITVPDANAVGGAVQVGDVVDVLYALQFDPAKFLRSPRPEQTSDFSAKIILERVTILARTTTVYTIRVDAVTAERIGYLQAAGGQLSFLLRAPKDERAAGTTGTTFGGVQGAFRLPIPEKISP